MSEMLLEGFSLSPINFFQISASCLHTSKPLTLKGYQRYLLPDSAGLTGEEPFAKVAMGWNKEGIHLYIVAEFPSNLVKYPDIEKGNSIEIFIDTRDVKTAGYNTRFCHHFFFLPETYEGISAGELTKFRTEDVHELCNPGELQVQTNVKKRNACIQIFIPGNCLYGYDPEQFDRIGFSYRINRAGADSQHFSVLSEEYPIEQQPSLWGSMRLERT